MSTHISNGKPPVPRLRTGAAVVASIALWTGLAFGAPSSKRLVFKDGTVESVDYYRIEGDRVIFKSPDREEEAVPRDRIDWNATEKAPAAPPAKAPRPDVRILSKEAREAAGGKEALIRRQNRQTPDGVDLPEGAGVYVLTDGKFQRLPDSDVTLHGDKGRKIGRLAGLPALRQKQTATLAGAKASARFKTGALTFYVDLPDTSPGRLQIVRLVRKGDHRDLAEVFVDLRGQAEMKQQSLPVNARTLENGLIQLRPAQPLAADEYALIAQSPSNPLQAGVVSLEKTVWDFGVDGSR